jgi:peptidase M28-like protein
MRRNDILPFMNRFGRTLAFLAAILAGACSGVSPWIASRLPPEEVVKGISGAELRRHVAKLASDEFAGRAPGTRGEDLTVDYLVAELKRAGLRPGNPDGTYVQDVPLIGIASIPSASFCVASQCTEWRFNQDFVGGSLFLQSQVDITGSEVVFVGYGLVAPEEGRDDYKDVDVHGKTVIMLASDPGRMDVPGEVRPQSSRSGGSYATRALALARQREEAVAKGAVARILIHEKTDPLGPLSAYAWSAEELEVEHRRAHHLSVSLRAEEEKVRSLVALTGHDLDELKRQASRKEFRPVALGATADLHVTNGLRKFVSRNVVARIQGSDSRGKDQYVVHVAHWDHLGQDASRGGDPTYHGALDNASGVAGLLEIARAYARLPNPPRRSVLLIATTGEEHGLLGARHYVESPLYPLNSTAAVINLDALNPWGPTRDFEIVGTASGGLQLAMIDAAGALGRELSSDTRPDMGFFYRSDQLEFSRIGVPAIWIRRGTNYIGKPSTYGREKNAAYFANDYHQPSDTPRADWDYAGMAEQVRFAFLTGYRLAMGD